MVTALSPPDFPVFFVIVSFNVVQTLQDFTMDCPLEEENRILLLMKRNGNIARKRFGERIAEICEKDHNQFLPTEVGYLLSYFCF